MSDWFVTQEQTFLLDFEVKNSLRYSQIHKYLDVHKVIVNFAVDIKTTKVQISRFNLRIFTSKARDPCRNFSTFYTYGSPFLRPKASGQLA